MTARSAPARSAGFCSASWTDITAYPSGIYTDGFGFGGFGLGGFGQSASTYTWTSEPLTSGTWYLRRRPVRFGRQSRYRGGDVGRRLRCRRCRRRSIRRICG